MVEFRILGTVNLIGAGGRELRAVLAQPKRVALLAYLAAAAPLRLHRRDSLVALFWPELDQEHARASLRQALHGLRRALGNDALQGRGDEEIGLDGQRVWCDAVAFEAAGTAGRYAEALELYRGDLLEGFFTSGAPGFERWVEDERASLRHRACDAAWTLAESCRASGDAALAAHWARRGAALAREDEGGLRRLIALLDGVGDKAGAVQAYEAFARRLAEDYDVDPAPETTALIKAVRSRQATIDAPPAPSAFPDASASDTGFIARPGGAGQSPPVPMGAQPAVNDAESPPTDAPSGEVPPRRPGHRRVAKITVTAAALGVVTLGARLVFGRDGPALEPTRVMVAAFLNQTGDTALATAGQLAAEEIRRGLELTDVVEVADPGAGMALRGGGPTSSPPPGEEPAFTRALALATRSGLAVWGTVYRHGNRLELVAHVVDQRSGRSLRTLEPVHADPRDVRPALMALRDRIMAVVSEAVDPRLGPSASVARDPPRYDAYLAFSTGVGIWYDGRNGRDALPHFARAARLDSTFALPLIWAAWVYQTLNQCDSTEALARRLARLELARLEKMQIDRQIARCRGDLPGAYRLAHALVDARPGSEVWQEQLARDALNFNRPREAAEILERLHPERGALRRRTSYYNWLSNAYHLLGEHERELDVARRARSRFPGNLAALRMELVALAALGRGAEVLERLDEIAPLPPDPIRNKATVMREVVLDLAVHGDSAVARAALDRTLALHASQPAAERGSEHLRFERAQVLYAVGHLDSARAIVADLLRAHPESVQYAGLLGVIAARRGEAAEAERADRLLERLERPHGRGRATYWRACIAAHWGRRRAAVDLLRDALARGHVFNDLFFLTAHAEPSFATLRSDPRFQQVLRPKG